MGSVLHGLNASVHQLRLLFSQLQPPEHQHLGGFFRARFVGPFWMRRSGPSVLKLMGLPGWQGKRFLGNAQATNVLLIKGQEFEALRMTMVLGPSMEDGKTGLALHYEKTAPWPWRRVRDELRALDEHRILGITIVDAPLLKHFRFPFILERA